MKLFFDTETTGLVNWSIPFDEQEARMVQLGMILTDDNLNTIHEVGLIIKPEGYEIPTGVAAIHGITNEMAMKYGIYSHLALRLFDTLRKQANEFIGHNLKFDKAIVASEMRKLQNDETVLKISDTYIWQEKSEYCTMLESTSICKFKGARGYKWPKLSEAYMYFFNEELIDAHDALTDVRATVRIYKELIKLSQPVC